MCGCKQILNGSVPAEDTTVPGCSLYVGWFGWLIRWLYLKRSGACFLKTSNWWKCRAGDIHLPTPHRQDCSPAKVLNHLTALSLIRPIYLADSFDYFLSHYPDTEFHPAVGKKKQTFTKQEILGKRKNKGATFYCLNWPLGSLQMWTISPLTTEPRTQTQQLQHTGFCSSSKKYLRSNWTYLHLLP